MLFPSNSSFCPLLAFRVSGTEMPLSHSRRSVLLPFPVRINTTLIVTFQLSVKLPQRRDKTFSWKTWLINLLVSQKLRNKAFPSEVVSK